MAIKVLGGLTAENFIDDDVVNKERRKIQKVLFDEGFTQGVQIRVGHDYTNGLPTTNLIEKINILDIPYIVHGPAENLGVDLGESLDQCGKFEAYKNEFPEDTWLGFNQKAISNALYVAANKKLAIDSRIVLHPGYSKYENYSNILDKIKLFLKTSLVGIPITFETIPALIFEDDEISYRGFGATAEEMKDLLQEKIEQDKSNILIDFTHAGVTSNQMDKLPSFFIQPKSFEQLISFWVLYPAACCVMFK